MPKHIYRKDDSDPVLRGCMREKSLQKKKEKDTDGGKPPGDCPETESGLAYRPTERIPHCTGNLCTNGNQQDYFMENHEPVQD